MYYYAIRQKRYMKKSFLYYMWTTLDIIKINIGTFALIESLQHCQLQMYFEMKPDTLDITFDVTWKYFSVNREPYCSYILYAKDFKKNILQYLPKYWVRDI